MICERCKNEITCISEPIERDREFKSGSIAYRVHKEILCLNCMKETDAIKREEKL